MNFIVLGALRSGTHLLATLLNSHSELKCYDEYYAHNPELVLDLKSPDELHDDEGLIILYNHLIHRIDSKQRNRILNNFKMFHIVRENIDKHAKSLYYLNHVDDVPIHSSNDDINVDYSENIDVQKQKQTILERRNKIERLIQNSDVIRLKYEWLTGNKNITELDKNKSEIICNFINKDSEILTTNLNKISKG